MFSTLSINQHSKIEISDDEFNLLTHIVPLTGPKTECTLIEKPWVCMHAYV